MSAIGPMVPFARVPGLIVQPESWFELGNPNRETVCIDLGYHLPGGDSPIFASGDDEEGTAPRIIAPSFEDWFLALLKSREVEYWFAPEFFAPGRPLGRAPAACRGSRTHRPVATVLAARFGVAGYRNRRTRDHRSTGNIAVGYRGDRPAQPAQQSGKGRRTGGEQGALRTQCRRRPQQNRAGKARGPF